MGAAAPHAQTYVPVTHDSVYIYNSWEAILDQWPDTMLVDPEIVAVTPYDIIIGYRADDSYFSFAKDFISNTISLEQLSRAMRLGKLGEQVVLKSKKAFDAVQFERDKCEYADSSIYFPLREKRDSEARTQYLSVERYNDVVNGLFIRDIMGRDMKNEDFSR
jgi:hypothetical protein